MIIHDASDCFLEVSSTTYMPGDGALQPKGAF